MSKHQYLVAASIKVESIDRALSDIDLALKKRANLVELRLDHHPSIDEQDIEKLLAHQPQFPKIATHRHVDEGGRFYREESERIQLLQHAVDCKAAYVDIELKHFHLFNRSNSSTQLIVSSHDFKETLGLEYLYPLYLDIVRTGADIVKIVTTARTFQDSWRILDLVQRAHADGGKIIGLCLKEKGILTREYSPLFGGYLTFASLEEGKETAPGQLSIDELFTRWQRMGIEC